MVDRGARSRWRSATSSSWRFMVTAGTHPYAYMWIVPLPVLALAVVPNRWSVPYLLTEAHARRFLEVLWQVNAAALALSVAIVVVALEVFSSRTLGSLQENVRDTALLPVAYVGSSALILNGLLLSQIVRSPLGGPATWAALISGLSLVLLPVLFGRASRAIDHAEMLKIRARRASEETRRTVDQSLFDRIAYTLLVQFCNEASIPLQVFLPPPAPAGAVLIRATRQGTVQDINLYQFARLARLAEASRSAAGGAHLSVRVGSRVGIGSSLVVLPPGLPPKGSRMARRIVKL
jgi:uncharacterized membrane protein